MSLTKETVEAHKIEFGNVHVRFLRFNKPYLALKADTIYRIEDLTPEEEPEATEPEIEKPSNLFRG